MEAYGDEEEDDDNLEAAPEELNDVNDHYIEEEQDIDNEYRFYDDNGNMI